MNCGENIQAPMVLRPLDLARGRGGQAQEASTSNEGVEREGSDEDGDRGEEESESEEGEESGIQWGPKLSAKRKER